MVGTNVFKALSFLSIATSAFSAPLTSPKTPLVVRNSPSVCDSSSKCQNFTAELTSGSLNPTNGIARTGILTNGVFPGPPLKLKVGDCVDFIVKNQLPDPTGVHFHGIKQNGSSWADGVPGLTQSPIQPGQSYMYQWTADEPGIFWYHSHYKGQVTDGLYGAIIIAPADDTDKPFSMIDSGAVDQLNNAESKVQPVFVSDWSQYTSSDLFSIEQNANIDFACTDSIILNGVGSVYCLSPSEIQANQSPVLPQILGNQTLTAKGCVPATNAATQGNYSRTPTAIPQNAYDKCNPASNKNLTISVDPADGWAAISFINPGDFSLLKVTIDNHKLYIFELNGHYIAPQVVDQVTVSIGDRVTFFVKLDQGVADYTIRVANSGVNQVIGGFGVLSYKGSSGPTTSPNALMNYGGQNSTAITLFSEILAAPYPALQVSQTSDKTRKMDIMKLPNQPDAYIWTLAGNASYDQSKDDQSPLLYQDPDTVPESELILKTNLGQWVDLITVISGPLAQPHPLHKHSNKFFVIGSGTGDFPYNSVAEAQSAGVPFNLQNPPYIDGYTTPPAANGPSWVVFRYKVEVAGAWLFHCHIQTHLTGGMAIAIMDGVDYWPKPPADAGKVCQKGTSSGSDGSYNGILNNNSVGNGIKIGGGSSKSGSGSSSHGPSPGSADAGASSPSTSSGSSASSSSDSNSTSLDSNDSNIKPYTGAASSSRSAELMSAFFAACTAAAALSL